MILYYVNLAYIKTRLIFGSASFHYVNFMMISVRFSAR